MAEKQSNLTYFKIPNPFSLFMSKNRQENKHSFTDGERKESATIRSLKKQVNQMDDLLVIKDEMIDSLQKDLKEFYSSKNENKMWSMVEEFLKNKTNPTQKSTLKNSENSPLSLTDGEIREQFQNAPKSIINGLLSLSDENKVKEIRRFSPKMDDKTINRGIKILKTMR